MKHKLQIIKSSIEPDNKHVLWLHKGTLKEFKDDGWEPILGGGIEEDDEPLGIPPDNEIWYKTCIKRRVHFGASENSGSGSSGTSGSSGVGGVGAPEEEPLKILNNIYTDKGVITFNKTVTELDKQGLCGSIGFDPDQAFVIDEIALPDSVTTLDSSVLNFTNLKSIISNNIEHIKNTDKIEMSLWAGSQESPMYLNKILMGCKEDVGEEYKVKEGTKVIAQGAFNGQQNLKKVILPDSVQILSPYCFSGCSGLIDINIGNCWIQSGALETTEWFNSNVSIEEPLVVIGKTLYSGHGEDTILKIPEGIKYFNGDALDLSTFSKIHIPDSIIDFTPIYTQDGKILSLNSKIPTKNPLTGCGYIGIEYNETVDKLKEQLELETSKWIYDQVYYVNCTNGKYWFIDLEAMPKLIYTTSDESLLHIYGNSSYWGNIIEEEYGTIYLKPGTIPQTLEPSYYHCDVEKLTSLEIPEGVACLDHTLQGANNLRTLTIPSSLNLFTNPLGSKINSLDTLIYKAQLAGCDGDYGFNESGSLKRVIIEEGVLSLPQNFVSMGIQSFGNTIEKISIPSSVEYIHTHAFGIPPNCGALGIEDMEPTVKNVHIEGYFPQTDQYPWGINFCERATLHADFELQDFRTITSPYSGFYRIEDTSGVHTLSKARMELVSGEWVHNLDYSNIYYLVNTMDYNKQVKDIVLLDCPQVPLEFCVGTNILTIDLQGGFTQISEMAFYGCTIRQIKLGKDINYIAKNAFKASKVNLIVYDGTSEEFRQKVTLEQPIGYTGIIECADGNISI